MESMQADMLKKLVERQDASMSAEKDRYDAVSFSFLFFDVPGIVLKPKL